MKLIDENKWFLKISKTGQPVLVISTNDFSPSKQITPSDTLTIISQKGIVVSYKGKNYFCRWNNVVYPSIPTPLDKLISMGTVRGKQEHILYLVYEIISGVSIYNAKLPVKKEAFDLQQLLSKYRKYEERYKTVDFEAIVKQLEEVLR